MPFFRRTHFHLLLSLVLIVALTAIGRADQTPDPAAHGKGLQLHAQSQLVMSAPALEVKTGARKEAASSSACLASGASGEFEFQPVPNGSRLTGGERPYFPLSDLCAWRGRAPPPA